MRKTNFAVLSFVLIAFCVAVSAQNYSIERYLNIRSAGSPTFSPDGKRIAFLTNITGTSQIWFVDAAGGYPEQMTSYADNVSFVRWSQKGNGLIFGKASGGDENTQFFWMSNDGAEIKQLTNAPKIRHNFGDISEDGTKIYYSSNKRNAEFFDIYSMNLADSKEELIYQQDGSNSFAAADAFGRKIIVSRSGTEFSLDNNLYLIDVESKKEILLTPHKDSAQFGNVNFTADGIVFAHNDKREFYSLAQLRQKNASGDDWSDANREVKILDETNWDIDNIEMQTYGSTLAYTINREGFSELYLRKYETNGKPLITVFANKSEAVKLPANGIVGGLTFSDDGKRLAFTFSNAKQNGDIWIYDLEKKSFTQVTKSSRSGIPQSSFVEPQLIKYKTFDGKEISAWYYKPIDQYGFVLTGGVGKNNPRNTDSNKTSTTKFNLNLPVIVSVHGGPEGQERPGFNPLYQYYLSRGYAILATNVRGSTGYGKTFTHLDDVRLREDSVKDLAYSVEWLKANGADSKRIAVMGGSYGGYMTLAAITLYPDLWAAAVDTVGISNWESFLKNTSGYRRRQREVEYGMLDKDIDFLRSISPIAKVDRIKCPLFVIQGKNDPRVPYTEAEQIVKAIRDKGGIVEYKLFDDEGHGISKLKNRLELYPLVADFLDKYMK
ncbi:S9 family peptidase [soil metagenome]